MGKDIDYFKDSVKRVLETQDKIFDEIKGIRDDYSKQLVHCENRFTKLESETKINSAIRGSVFGAVAAFFVFFGKWLFDKITN